MRRWLILTLASMAIVFAQKKPFDFAAMMELKRMGDPQISPDGKWVTFTVQTVDVAANKKPSQIWMGPLAGGDPRQATNLSTEAGGVLFSPDGKNLLFTSDVYPECGTDEACNKKNLDAEKNSKVKARIYTELLYRHWTAWQGKRRSHVLVVGA